MSGRRGLLGQIARARADMLLRGHQRLKLELGAGSVSV